MSSPKKTIVVTGGARGIGRCICRELACDDAHVFFNYASSEKDAQETCRLICAEGGEVSCERADIASSPEVERFFKRILDETGRIDVLVNNAGIARDGLLVRMKESDWDEVLDTNLKGAFTCTKIAAKTMIRQKHGRIINITSLVGAAGNPGQVNYVAAKAGLIGMTKACAKELASRSITVNAVAPGYIETEMTTSLPKEKREEMIGQIPLGRPGRPEDVAAVVAFLASDRAAYITGQVIHVNGGMYI
jgi:3-oxoacyl-[acyl-carrier protein] reductase